MKGKLLSCRDLGNIPYFACFSGLYCLNPILVNHLVKDTRGHKMVRALNTECFIEVSECNKCVCLPSVFSSCLITNAHM